MKTNNKRKGFTLIEVLGVIVILLLLILITTPIVINYLKKANKDAESVQEYTIKEAAKSWLSSRDNISLTPASSNECIEVTLRELKEQGYVDYDIKNPENKELFSDDLTVVIRKEESNLTYEINNTGNQVCNVIVDSEYPRWTYVSSNKTAITKDDTVVIKVKSTDDIKDYELDPEDIIVKAGSEIIDNAIIDNISCTGTNEITCEITIRNLDKDGNLNLIIDKDTLTNENDKKSRKTPVLTDVIIDNQGPTITYVAKSNTNESGIYATDDDEIVIVFDIKDANISTDLLTIDGVEIYVGNTLQDVTKVISRESIENGYRYELKLTDVVGDGELSIKIKGDQISDTLGNKNEEKIITPGITIDNTIPVITIDPNGNSTAKKSASATITAEDDNGIKEPLKYIWSVNTTDDEYNLNATNGAVVSIDDVTGDYYLIVKACDLAGNCNVEVSNKFSLSNRAPEILFIQDGNTSYESSKDVIIRAIANGAEISPATLRYTISENINDITTKEFTNNEPVSLENLSGTYYIIAEACDVLDNCTRKVSNPYHLDGESPKLKYVSKTNTNRTAGQEIEYATKSDTITIVFDGTDNISYNDILTANDITIRVNGVAVDVTKNLSSSNITGGKRYTLTLTNITGEGQLSIQIDETKVTDTAGNHTMFGIITPGIIIDNTKPTISLSPDGNDIYQQSQSSTISVTDNNEVNNPENLYIWSTNNNDIVTESFTNNATVTKNEVTGDYYLIVEACDKAGNCERKESNIFKLDNQKPTITFGPNGNSTPTSTQSSTITVLDELSGGNTTTYRYIWTNDPSNATPTDIFTSGNSYSQISGDGNYYIVAYACDNAGNCETATSNAFVLDNTAPSCSFSGENTTWTRNDVTVTVTCSDTNGCKADKSTYSWTYSSGTHSTENLSYEVEDNAGNTTTCSKNAAIYLDKEAPTVPVVCNIGTVSGSNTTGTIETPAAGSTDLGVGNITYKYIINTTGTAPANTNSSFDTSMNFTRSCGTSYYAYAIAIDGLGNISEVKSCGTTSDGADSYSEWGTCSASCGGGTQTRTNSCELITEDLSQSCNEQACCTEGERVVIYESTSGLRMYDGKYETWGDHCWQDNDGDWHGCYYEHYDRPTAYSCNSSNQCTILPSGQTSFASDFGTTFEVDTEKYNKVEIVYKQGQKWKYNGTGGIAGPFNYFYLNIGPWQGTLSGFHLTTNDLGMGENFWYWGPVAIGEGINNDMTTGVVTGTFDFSSIKNTGIQTMSFTDHFETHQTTLDATVYKITLLTYCQGGEVANGPTITFGTNGNSTYAKSQSSAITVTSTNPIDESSLKYIWTFDKNQTPTTSFTNGNNYSINGVSGVYYLVATACDTLGNCTTAASNPFYLDNTAPSIVITPNGDNVVAKSHTASITVTDGYAPINASSLKYKWTTNTSDTPTESFSNGESYTINGVTGTYYLVVEACDNANNCSRKVSDGFVLDNTSPVITFGTNGNTTYEKSQSSTITISGSNLDASTFKYTWSTDINASTNTLFTSGDTATKDSVSGDYYLIVEACNTVGNCTREVSNVFKLDNEAPVITLVPDGNTTYAKSQSSTITVTDSKSGGNASTYKYIWSETNTATADTSFVNNETVTKDNATGSYYLIVHACDNAGNCADKVSQNVFNVSNSGPVIEFTPNGNDTFARSQTTSIKVTASGAPLDTSSFKYIWVTSSTATDTPNVAFTNNESISKNGVTGLYYVKAIACDTANNCTTATSNAFKLDNIAPEITFGTNGNSTYAKSQSSTITVNDNHSGGNTTSYKYVWSTSQTTTPTTGFTNGATVTKNTDSGDYYLVVTACDNAGNCNEKVASNVFKLDNEAPTVTLTPDGNTTYAQSQSSKIEVTDNYSGGKADTYKYIWSTNSSDTATELFTNNETVTKDGVTGSYYLIVHACDNAGNCTDKVSTNVFNVSNSGPTITFGTDGNSTYAKSQSSTINVTAGAAPLDTTSFKYIWVTSSTATDTPNVAFTNGATATQNSGTGNYYIKATACDTVGNCTTTTSNAFLLDNTAPTITFGTNGNSTYQQSQSSTITVNDGHSGGNTSTYEYVWSTNTSGTPSESFTSGSTYTKDGVTGNYYLIAKACDKAGNCTSNVVSNVFKLDNEAPTITLAPDGNTTYAQSQSSKITVADNKSGGNVSTYKYIWSEDSTATADTSFTNNETVSKSGVNGAYYLIVHACDNAGNCADKVSETVFNISNSGPTITFGTNGNSTYQQSQSSTINVTSNGAALDTSSFKYIWVTSSDSTATPNVSYTNGGTASKDTETGNYYIKATACDVAGNCTTVTSNVFKLDNEAPTITLLPDGNTTYAQSQSSKITVADNKSGGNASTYKYIWSENSTATANTTFTSGNNVTLSGTTGSYYLIVHACDNAGNCADKVSTTVFNVTNSGPTITFGTNGNTTYAKSQSTTINVTSNGAALDTSSFKYIWSTDGSGTPNVSYTNGGTASKDTETGDYYIKATACDVAGNCTTVTSNVFKLDNIAPTITFDANGNSTYQQSQSSTITVNDGHSGGKADTYKYIWSTNTTANPSTSFTNGTTVTKDTETGDYYLIATACDNAGNCTEKVVSNVFKLDNEAPIITLLPDGNTTYAQSQSSKITVADNKSGGNTSTYKYIWSTTQTATPNASFTSGNNVTLSGTTGSYYLIVHACDNAGNCADKISTTVFNVSNSGPTITFGTNGNETYAKSQSTTINVTAGGAPLDTTSFKYTWGTNASGSTPSTLFTNNAQVSKDTETGNYYVTAKACDTAGNCTTVTSNVFKLDNIAPTITFGTNGNSNWSKTHTTTINVSDGHSGENESTFKYRWTDGVNLTGESSYTNGGTISAGNENTTLYLRATACDNAGNCTIETSNGFNFDNTAPTCNYSGENTTWVGGPSYTGSITVTVTCSDANGCKPNKSTNSWTYSSGTHATEPISFEIEDNAGNKTLCSKNASIYLDKEGPTVPTIGSIGTVSGSDTTGTIATAASGSTDLGIGNITYRYLVNTTGVTPTNTDNNFKTSKNFERSCGTSYYAFAIAIDGLGNRSEVKSLGSTSDGANSYSEWGTCSVSCGGGIQTRTNSCALITSDLSQSCNTQSCCQMPAITSWDFGYSGSPTPFTVPEDGTYKLEVYGAQGGGASNHPGGKGGYSSGNVKLTAGTTIYVVVGGAGASSTTVPSNGGTGYNGGGSSTSSSIGGGGGGATHIGTFNSTLSDHGNTSGLYIVAGGGGGSMYGFATAEGNGGSGGGTSGERGTWDTYCGSGSGVCNYSGAPGTQTEAGGNVFSYDSTYAGGFGYGGGALVNNSNEHKNYVAGGGGGLYGGGPAYYYAGAGGGSGYVGGVTSGTMNNGVQEGNGYARITLVKLDCDENDVDLQGPTITFGTNGNSTYAKSQSSTITVTDNVGVDASSLRYIWTTDLSATPNASFVNGSNQTINDVTGTYYLKAYACDTSGNCTTATSNAFKLDNIAPTIDFGINGNSTYAKSQSTTINITDNHSSGNAETYRYIWTASPSTENPNAIFADGDNVTKSGETGDYYLKVYACDRAGNCAMVTSNVFKLDNTAPEITLTPDGNTTWATSQSSKITVVDNHSGGNSETYKYIWSETNTSTATESFTNNETVTKNDASGSYYLIVHACDNVGNCSDKVSENVFNVGINGPTIEFVTNGSSTYKQSHSTTVNVTSGGAPLDTSTFKVRWVTSKTSTETPNTLFTNGQTIERNEGTGNYYLKATACDVAGNCTTVVSNAFKLDNTAPTVEFGTNGNSNYDKIQSSTITINDLHSGGKSSTYKYIWSTSTTTNPTESFTSGTTVTDNTDTGNYYIVVTACDNAGNCAEKVASNVFKLDNTAPVITLTPDGNETWATSQTSTINVADAHSGENANTFKYIWSTSNTSTATESFANNESVELSSVTGSYYLIVHACDNVGNCADKVSDTVFNAAINGPSIEFTNNGTSNYVKSVSTNINVISGGAPLDTSTFKYKWVRSPSAEDTPTTSFTNGKKVSGSSGTGYYYIKATACDIVGNCTTTVSNAFMLDNTAPTIAFTYNKNNVYKQSQSSTITVTDLHSGGNSETYKYIWSTDSTTEPTTTFTSGNAYTKNSDTGIYYIVATACDNLGNCATTSSNAFKLDNTAPEITLTPDGNTTYAKSQSSTINVTDNHSGGDTTTYKYIWSETNTSTANTLFTNNETVTKDGVTGSYYLIVRACDNAGNCADKVSENVFNITNSGPRIDFEEDGSSSYAKSHSTKIKVTQGDAPLDTSSFKYIWSTSQTATPNTAFTNNGTVTQDSVNGTYYVRAKACDTLGNCTIATSQAFMFDNEAPVITFNPDGNETWALNYSSKITVTDNLSGGDTTTYKYIWSTDSTATANTSFISGNNVTLANATGSYYLIAHACDNAGNCADKVSETVFNVSNIGPTITFDYLDGTDYAKGHSAKINVTAGGTPLDTSTFKYKWSASTTANPDVNGTAYSSGATAEKTGGNGPFYIRAKACDVAGNCTVVTSDAIYFDNTAPTVTFDKNGDTNYAKSHSTTVTVTDTHSGGNTSTYKSIWSTDPTANPKTAFVSGTEYTKSGVTGDYYLVITACDNVGNCAEKVASNVFKFDNEGPTITFSTNATDDDYLKSHSTTINVTASGAPVDTSTFVYKWTQNQTPNMTTNVSAFTNNGSVTKSTDDGTWYVAAKACDTLGNCTTQLSQVFNFDNTAPTIEFGTNGDSNYAKSHSSTITVSNGGTGSDLDTSTYVYKWTQNQNANMTTNVNPFVSGNSYSEGNDPDINGTYYIRAKACDKAGNCATTLSNEFNFDNTAPTVTFDKNGDTNYAKSHATTVTVTDTHSGGNTSTYKSIWSTDPTANPKTAFVSGTEYTKSGVTGDYYLVITACDNAGNCAEKVASNVFKFDNEGPTITFSTNATDDDYLKSHSTTINVTTSGAPVDTSTFKYKWSASTSANPDSSGLDYSSGDTLLKSDGNGTWYVRAKACDTLGNCTTVTSQAFNFDNKAPTITFDSNGDSNYAKSHSSTITVSNGTNPGSDLDTSTYVYKWSKNQSVSMASGGTSFASGDSVEYASNDGAIYIRAKACDTAGNCATTTSEAFMFDNTAPTITFDKNGDTNYAKSHASTITVTDNGSGGNAESYIYTWSTSNTAEPDTPFVSGTEYSKDQVTGNYYIVATACDNAGNCNTKKASKVFRLDNEGPTIAFGTPGNSTYAKSQSTTINVTASGAPVDTSTYVYKWTQEQTPNMSTGVTSFINGGTATKSTDDGTYYVAAKACDTLGNCTTTLSPGFNLDNTAPQIKYSKNGNSTYAKSQSSKITVTDNLSGGDTSTYEYVWLDDSTATPNTSFTSGTSYTKNGVTGDYYLIATACDNAGNCNENYTSNVFKLDNMAPEITFNPNGNSTPAKSQSSTITVSDSHSGGNTDTYKYIWSKNTTTTPTTLFASGDTVTQSSGTGNYYIVVTACDIVNNCNTKYVSNAFVVDNTAPTCEYSGENTTWTKNNVTVTVTCNDANGCKTNKSTKSWAYTSGTHSTEAISFEIEDVAGNKRTCSKTASVFVDKEPPTVPNCSAPTISGSNPAATGSTASGSTDAGVGGIVYKYIINNSSTTPSKTSSSFTTSNSFTRSCGKTYYEYAIAEDALGNKSNVKVCGSASDGANSYSEWGACSESCGGGTQTRTNTCLLVTENLSQACNTQECCVQGEVDVLYENPTGFNIQLIGHDGGYTSNYTSSEAKDSAGIASGCFHNYNFDTYTVNGISGQTINIDTSKYYKIEVTFKHNRTWNFVNTGCICGPFDYFTINIGNHRYSMSGQHITQNGNCASMSGYATLLYNTPVGDGIAHYGDISDLHNNISNYMTLDTVTETFDILDLKGSGVLPITFTVHQESWYPTLDAQILSIKAYRNCDVEEPTIVDDNTCDMTIGNTWDFEYTGDVQEFIAPVTGNYKLETWGAQGGSVYLPNGCSPTAEEQANFIGGQGGYSSGYVRLNQGDRLYIAVGGQGGSITSPNCAGGGYLYNDRDISHITGAAGGYNGGGRGGDGSWYSSTNNGATLPGTGGGGATHIAKNNNRGVLKNYVENKDEILIVAGGGGGASRWYEHVTTGGAVSGPAGAGGGLSGTPGHSITNIYPESSEMTTFDIEVRPGTQISGNYFGVGSTGRNSCFNYSEVENGSGGGGGGWYGGTTPAVYEIITVGVINPEVGYICANGTAGDVYPTSSGSGGSGYIGGVYNGTSTAGGRNGNGYARITLDSCQGTCAISNATNTWNFEYTGNIQSLTITQSGLYNLEVWGAQGGAVSDSATSTDVGGGALGGYSSGDIYLNAGDVLYIGVGEVGHVGGQRLSDATTFTTNASYNGGSKAYFAVGNYTSGYGGGGGATHIALNNNRGVLKNYSNYKSALLVVAGGGGGSQRTYGAGQTAVAIGGAGGGTTGNDGNKAAAGTGTNVNAISAGAGGTQTTGYAFGEGNPNGGGGGYYGGNSTNGLAYWSDGDNSGHAYAAGAGGGSGYIKTTLTNASSSNGVREGNGYARVRLLVPDCGD